MVAYAFKLVCICIYLVCVCVCVCISSPPGSGFHHHLPLASLNHVIHHVNLVITYHYAEVRFQWHHSIQQPIWVFTTCQHWLLFSILQVWEENKHLLFTQSTNQNGLMPAEADSEHDMAIILEWMGRNGQVWVGVLKGYFVNQPEKEGVISAPLNVCVLMLVCPHVTNQSIKVLYITHIQWTWVDMEAITKLICPLLPNHRP